MSTSNCESNVDVSTNNTLLEEKTNITTTGSNITESTTPPNHATAATMPSNNQNTMNPDPLGASHKALGLSTHFEMLYPSCGPSSTSEWNHFASVMPLPPPPMSAASFSPLSFEVANAASGPPATPASDKFTQQLKDVLHSVQVPQSVLVV